MRVDEAPGGQAGECRLYPSRLKLWVSGKGAHILQDSLLDALDQSSCIRASFLCVVTSPVLGPHGTPIGLRPGSGPGQSWFRW